MRSVYRFTTALLGPWCHPLTCMLLRIRLTDDSSPTLWFHPVSCYLPPPFRREFWWHFVGNIRANRCEAVRGMFGGCYCAATIYVNLCDSMQCRPLDTIFESAASASSTIPAWEWKSALNVLHSACLLRHKPDSGQSPNRFCLVLAQAQSDSLLPRDSLDFQAPPPYYPFMNGRLGCRCRLLHCAAQVAWV